MPEVPQNGIEQRIQQHEALQRNPLETMPITNEPHGNIPNTPFAASITAFFLGCVFSAGSLVAWRGWLDDWWWTTYQLGFFVASWSFFHWGEFAVTAGWNLEKCSIDSFLLDNGAMYHIAHGMALAEYLIMLYSRPAWKAFPYFSQIGMILVIAGQILRSAAMIHASTNFSHSVAFRKRVNHQLVINGVYAWFRHPSYAGFFYWALGTQLVLQNPLSFCIYSILLWKFFYYRTRAEEKVLVKFFGDEYLRYQQRVGTRMPFIP